MEKLAWRDELAMQVEGMCWRGKGRKGEGGKECVLLSSTLLFVLTRWIPFEGRHQLTRFRFLLGKLEVYERVGVC